MDSKTLAEHLSASLPEWHFEPYGLSCHVACFPPRGYTGFKAWQELAGVAYIESVCGPLYVVSSLRSPVCTR